MKSLLISLLLFAGQMVSMQPKHVVHLRPNSDAIDIGFAGSILELQNAPEYIHLPSPTPSRDPQGNEWAIEIRNFGPHPVIVIDKDHFSQRINASQTIHIYSNGSRYILKR
jgi:hypothetical protein